jgi:tetratricopeptide (TPR) repeat protein
MATTATQASYTTLSLKDAALAAPPSPYASVTAPDPLRKQRARLRLRDELGIASFGTTAVYQGEAGGRVVSEHDELGPGASGHEELYVVVSGGCTFTVDGDEVDAPHGSVVFIRDPAAKRSAVATADGTVVLAVGGKPGEAYRPSAGQALAEFFRLYGEKNWEAALPVCHEVLVEYPGNAMVLYNIACLESLLGRPDDALEALGESLAAWPAYKELAANDDDFATLRDDARFQALVA